MYHMVTSSDILNQNIYLAPPFKQSQWTFNFLYLYHIANRSIQ